MFLLAVFGLPYLMGKLIRALAHSQEAEEIRRRQQEMSGAVVGPNGQLVHPSDPQAIIDPSKLDFCRLLYDYNPPSQAPGAAAGIDLSAKKGDLVAVLSKTDPMGNPSEWWRCRARDGSVGYLPSPYLETIQRRQPAAGAPQGQITAGSAPGSRTATLKTVYSGNGREGEGRSKSLSSVGVGVRQPVKVQAGGGDGAAESFQKSAFYS
jgi:peroxin-13